MLLADDHTVAIPTATKTGTFSLESALRNRGFTQRMPRHATAIPEEWHGAHVFFMARNPYARLVSMYRYGIVKKHSWLLQAGAGGFEAFCHNWAAARDAGRPHDWVTLCAEYVAAAKETNSRVTVLRLEHDGVRGLLERLGFPPQEKHINRSADRFDEPWAKLWTSAALKAVGDRLAPDLELGQYQKPRAARHVPADR